MVADLIALNSEDRLNQQAVRASARRRILSGPLLSASSSASYDLGEKKQVYQHAGVLEYLVYETEKQELAWWRLENGVYVELPAVEGTLKSFEFQGLWLDESAIRAGDGKTLLATLAEGMRSIS
ncbi:hypothetical protein CKO51_13540 [Rhodopirellula sp. SM50]|nr:Uma2 family endonuclease [Rhodopirellula sp. SM50]PAY18975.1 hypothetical protein CKO51_13540 [Rhodopirellula sp. SM50]